MSSVFLLCFPLVSMCPDTLEGKLAPVPFLTLLCRSGDEHVAHPCRSSEEEEETQNASQKPPCASPGGAAPLASLPYGTQPSLCSTWCSRGVGSAWRNPALQSHIQIPEVQERSFYPLKSGNILAGS